jgi:aspartate racemase
VSAVNLAYVSYTSGSTGEPKGVEATHRNVVRLVKSDYVRFGTSETTLHLAPLSFDASTFEIWGALLNGGRLVVAPPRALSAAELGAILDAQRVTTLWLTAGLFERVVEDRIESLRPLRQLLAGGDVLSPEHVRRVREAFPELRLLNGYGPTEGTTFTCCHTVERTPPQRSVPIGKPIANTRVYVLDRRLRPVPVGARGELWIAGDGLARGYRNRPQLTAERFVVHRLSPTLGERLYRTGDLARWLSDGTLEFFGRIDDQIKIRGFRVEPGEIEAALARHPDVSDCVVIAIRAVDGAARLAAYVVGSAAPSELREFLARSLPDYMIPTAFVPIDHLPLNTSGKVDRRALPDPGGVAGSGAPVEPRDDLERQIAEVWRDVLLVEHVGIRDSFFDLGGHSLLAVRMFARLEKQRGVVLPLATLFEAPTIEGLAEAIRRGTRPTSKRSLVAIQPAGGSPPLFVVPGVGGSILGYHTLARLLGLDQPFYGLQSRGLDGTTRPLTRIETIAAEYLAEIRQVQPVGPYYLMGACMGGVVTYEMAQQLRTSGQEVAFLGLLETWPPDGRATPAAELAMRAPKFAALISARLKLYVETARQLNGRELLRFVGGRLKRIGAVIVGRDPLRGVRGELSRLAVTNANLAAFQRYVPQPYSDGIVLFWAEGRKVEPADDLRRVWLDLVPRRVEVCVLPGDDSGLMLTEPHVRALATKLRECLTTARTRETAHKT